MLRSRIFRGACLSVAGALCLSAMLQAQNGAAVADAAMSGNREVVRGLLKEGGDVNAAQGDGMTALHWAAMKGNAELAQMLVYAGANVKATTRLGAYTPLMMAAKYGHSAVVATLLAAGADAKAPTTTGATPMMLAAASGDVRSVTMLIEGGADVNAQESVMGQTPLMFAAASNRVDVIKTLLQRGADVKLTTKVVDLAALSSPDEESLAQQQQQNRPPGAAAAAGPANAPAAAPPGRGGAATGKAGLDRQFRFNELVGTQGGLSPLLFAARQGHIDAVRALVDGGADVNQLSAGDQASPLLISVINGNFDIAKYLLDKGALPTVASAAGVTPLYGVLNVQWAPKALYPQPRAYLQQQLTHLELMQALLDKGADPNARVSRKVWYSGYNFDLAGVDEIGATPFWRAAYGGDVDAMTMLVKYGADVNIPSMKPAGRPRTGDGGREGAMRDISGLPAIPVGGPGVPALLAAAGVGYGEGFAANSHRYAPGGLLVAIKYLVEVAGADVNAVDHEGYTAVHHCAARGDNECIEYLVSKGADVTRLSREGQTTVDMANGPVQRTQPYPATIALLEKLGATNNHKCVSC